MFLQWRIFTEWRRRPYRAWPQYQYIQRRSLVFCMKQTYLSVIQNNTSALTASKKSNKIFGWPLKKPLQISNPLPTSQQLDFFLLYAKSCPEGGAAFPPHTNTHTCTSSDPFWVPSVGKKQTTEKTKQQKINQMHARAAPIGGIQRTHSLLVAHVLQKKKNNKIETKTRWKGATAGDRK